MTPQASDLHKGFHDPRQVAAGDLERFLAESDRLPGMRTVRAALRRALPLRPGMRLLDAGCGIGLEAARLAEEHPEVHVTGLDRNPELLDIARRRTEHGPDNVEWVEADLTDPGLPARSFDAIRTERVLMYLPGDRLDAALDHLVNALRPGGRIATFELDYGATILAPGSAPMRVIDRVVATLQESLPQPFAGRLLQGMLRARGLRDVDAEPLSFRVSAPVWRRIVGDTVRAADPDDPGVHEWLREQDEAAERGELVAAFTGVLTSATAP